MGFAYAAKGLPVSAVRYFNAYGPRLDPKGYGSVIAKFVMQALQGGPLTVFGDGRQTRSFTYITDIILGTLAAGQIPAASGMAFNIGSSQETSILELAQMICQHVSVQVAVEHVPYEQAYGVRFFEDTRRRVPDVEQAAEVLGFRAKTPLEEGLRQTISWFRERAI
jgi:UDP-glucose 4-epimerase